MRRKKNVGSWVESEVANFISVFTVAFLLFLGGSNPAGHFLTLHIYLHKLSNKLFVFQFKTLPKIVNTTFIEHIYLLFDYLFFFYK